MRQTAQGMSGGIMRILFAALTVFATATNAETVTIDFEEWSGYQIVGTVTSKGYRLSPNTGTSTVIHTHITMDYVWNNLGVAGEKGTTISREDGGSFWLIQFDAGNWESGGGNTYTDFFAIGTLASTGSQVFYQFDANEGMQTFSPTGLGALSSLQFITPARQNNVDAGFHLDNIVISTVPIPAGVWLFGSAIAAIGWHRRKLSG
jgi:hypothetical protein